MWDHYVEEGMYVRQVNLKIPQIYILGSPGGTGKYSQKLLSAAGVEWKVVEDAGHWPFIDRPRQFINEMVCFLNRL